MTREELKKLAETNDGIKVKKDGKIYVSNPILLREIIKSKEQNELTKEAVEMFMVLIENLSTALIYERPEDKEDCLAHAMLDCLSYWRNFNPDLSSNPFAYFTSVASNGIRKGWRSLGYKGAEFPKSLFTSLDNSIHTF